MRLCIRRVYQVCFAVVIITVIFIMYYNKNKYGSVVFSSPLYQNFIQCTFHNYSEIQIHTLPRNRPWLIVENRKFVAYSAYYVESSSIITMLGIRHINDWRKYLCIIWSTYDNITWRIDIKECVSLLINQISPCFWINHCLDKPFDAFYIKSTVDSKLRPVFISLLPIENGISSCYNLSALPKVTVDYLGVSPTRKELTVCVSPIFDWDNIVMLKLFLEHYLSQGFTRFLLYKRSWSTRVTAVIKNKRYRKFIEVINWPLFPNVSYANLNDESTVHYKGQLLAVNDCVWKLKGRSKFVAIVDLDEFIVPHASFRNFTVSDLLTISDNVKVGGFVIRNRYITFNISTINSRSRVIIDNSKIVQSRLTKMIVKPETTDKLSIHNVWRYEDGFVDDNDFSPSYVLKLHWKPHLFSNFSDNAFSDVFPKLVDTLKYVN